MRRSSPPCARLYGYQFAHPGKKLMFMGGEFAQFIEWNYLQQLDWSLLEYPCMTVCANMSASSGGSTPPPRALEGGRLLGRLLLAQRGRLGRSSVAFMRMSQRSYIVCALNFTPVRYDDFTIGLPKPGVLKELINSDDTQYGGSGILNKAEIESADESFLTTPARPR